MDLLNAIYDWISDPDNLTAISTLTIALFTIVLALVTGRQAALTKESIRVTERALLDLERARIVLAFPKPVERDADERYVHISLSNVGRSFGIVKSVFFRFAAPDAFPVKPPKKGYEERTAAVVLRFDESWSGLAPFKLPSKQEGQIIYGYIRYEDVFGRIWRNRFACAVWSEEKPGQDFYQPVGGDAYNSEIEEM
jgi:hypothetical protein